MLERLYNSPFANDSDDIEEEDEKEVKKEEDRDIADIGDDDKEDKWADDDWAEREQMIQ